MKENFGINKQLIIKPHVLVFTNIASNLITPLNFQKIKNVLIIKTISINSIKNLFFKFNNSNLMIFFFDSIENTGFKD